jgi:hypothetical protein
VSIWLPGATSLSRYLSVTAIGAHISAPCPLIACGSISAGGGTVFYQIIGNGDVIRRFSTPLRTDSLFGHHRVGSASRGRRGSLMCRDFLRRMIYPFFSFSLVSYIVSCVANSIIYMYRFFCSLSLSLSICSDSSPFCSRMCLKNYTFCSWYIVWPTTPLSSA